MTYSGLSRYNPMITTYILHIIYSVNALMNSRIPLGASRVNRCRTQFPRLHLLLASTVAVAVMGIMALLPSGDVEAKRNEIPMSIDAFASNSVESISSKRNDGHAAFGNSQAEVAAPKAKAGATRANPTTPETEKARMQQAKAEAAAKALARKAYDLEQQLGKWHTVTIRPGDNLSSLFNAQKLSASVVYQITNTPRFGEALTHILPGESLEFRINPQGVLTQFRYVKSKLENIFFSKTAAGGYQAELITQSPEVKTSFASGTIKSSLFMASQEAGLSENLTMELAGIFGWDIDFVQDIRSGDAFEVLFEENYLDDEKLNDGDILAASFTNQGQTYTAIRYTDSKGNTAYYSPDGKSMKKAFLRSPVDFTRISSRFNPNRLHPVFKTKRPHRGVDYAAPMNTPIKAAGDGRIQFSGWQNGFGNVVYIQHPNNIVTVYAHANKLAGLKKGQKVRQGQVIAYVGKTGWATGPHLHYEFRVNGEHRNPMTVKLPDAAPIGKSEMVKFSQVSGQMISQLAKQSGTMLATQ